MKVVIQFEDTDEEYGNGEVYAYQREVRDIDHYDLVEFLLEAGRVVGMDWVKLQVVTGNGTLISTED